MSVLLLAPPITPPAQVDAALREHGQAVLDGAGVHAMLDAPAGALAAWAPYWERLAPDTYLRDGGRYRLRRHGSFVVERGAVTPAPPRAHWQPLE